MRGVIAAGTPKTAAAGAVMYEQGGNAVDAAVAAAFASFVAEPASSAVGGGGYATLVSGDEAVVYDFFCTYPSGQPGDDLDFGPVPVPFGDVTGTYYVGRGSTAVPGNPAGLALLLKEAGTLPLAAVLEPAIRLARDGVVVSEAQATVFRSLGNVLVHTPSSRAYFAPDGELLAQSEHYRNPELADALAMIQHAGPATFYTGTLADAIIADQQRKGGLVTSADLAAYRVIKRQPLISEYRGNRVYTNPPPSTGGILIANALRLLEQADLASMQHGDWDHIALLVEIMRQTNTARYRDQPKTLPDASGWLHWLRDERIQADWHAVSEALAAGPTDDDQHESSGSPHTTHISAVDQNGLCVSITTTPGATGGYAVNGMILNNMLGETDLNPLGFHQGTPGERVESMTAPTVVIGRSGQQVVLGSAGSSRLRSAIVQVISNLADWHYPLNKAVDLARVHWEGEHIDLEKGYDPAVAAQLEAFGYRVLMWQTVNLYFGGANVALRRPDGSFAGAGDPRRGGGFVVVD